MYALMKDGSIRIASSASFRASGKAASLVYAAARLLYARGSDLQRNGELHPIADRKEHTVIA